jgi:hypothetical protein
MLHVFSTNQIKLMAQKPKATYIIERREYILCSIILYTRLTIQLIQKNKNMVMKF